MPQKDTNNGTLQTYKVKFQEYIDATPAVINDAEYPWIDHSLSYIPDGGSILELGSGAGRNATYILGRGYKLECTDAVQEFVDLMRDKGLHAHLLNILTDQINKKYDMVFANAVLVHFTPVQTRDVLSKVCSALKPGGIFAVSLKMGEGEKWTEEKLGAPRYFCYWQPDIFEALAEDAGFERLRISTGETSLRNADWLYMILKKK